MTTSSSSSDRPWTRLHDGLRELRNRLFASPSFQRWASWFPLTRGIAHRRAMRTFDLCNGFVYTKVLSAALELDLLAHLRTAPATLPELAERLQLPPERLLTLLRACLALNLLERRAEDRFALGSEGAVLIANPGALRMIEHHALFYRDLADPVALVRGGVNTELRNFWAYGSGAVAPAQAYSTLMAGSVGLVTDDILDAVPLGAYRRFLDVGGGEGAFLEAVAARAPHLLLSLFDLPPVAERARVRLKPLGDRATVFGGDMFNDPLPAGQDAISLVRVVHDHDDGPALALLQAARRALAPGGVLILAEPMAGTPGAERMGDAYFGFYLLAMGQGRPRTEEELRAMLSAAGFAHVRRRQTRRPMQVRVLVATAPR